MNVNGIMNFNATELNIYLKLAEQIDKITTNKMNEYDINLQLKLSEYEEKINELQLEMNEVKRYVLNNLQCVPYSKNYQKAKYIRVKFSTIQTRPCIWFIQFINDKNASSTIDQIHSLKGNNRTLVASNTTKTYEWYKRLSKLHNNPISYYSNIIEDIIDTHEYVNNPCLGKRLLMTNEDGSTNVTYTFVLEQEEFIECILADGGNLDNTQIEMLDTNGILFYKSSWDNKNTFKHIKEKESFLKLEYESTHWHVFKVDPSNLFDPEHSYN